MKPSAKATQEALQDALGLPDVPKRIECFDISHIQGAETVASMVVWEDGKMNKQEYRKFIVRTVEGVDDFASMREVVTRRYKRLRDEKKSFPSLVLVDGGLGQLHAAAEALEELAITNQPLAAIAKKKRSFTSTGRRMSRWSWIDTPPCCIWCKWCVTNHTALPLPFHRKRRQNARPEIRTSGDPRRGRTDPAKVVTAFRQRARRAAGRCRRAGRGADQASNGSGAAAFSEVRIKFSVKIGFSASNTVYERYHMP